MGGGVPPHYEDVDLLNQPEVASSTAQVIDTEPLASPTNPAFDVAGQIQDAPAVEEIAVVAPSTREVEVINCRDIDSCDSKRRLLGDSTDEDNDDDDDGVNEGVPLPAAIASELDIVDPALAPRSAPVVGSLPPASIIVASSSIPAVDEFYNAAGKAPHPESIIPKQEPSWWANREMRKRRKAEERANSTRELQRIQEKAARLAKQNATLQWELNLAQQSNFGAIAPAMPSTSTASVKGRRCTRLVGVILGCVRQQVGRLLLRPLHLQLLLGLFVRAVLNIVQAGVSFILDPKIIPLHLGRCFKLQSTLFNFRPRRRWMQPIQQRVCKGCHSMMLGI